MATATTAKTQSGPVLTDWRPEDNEFWSAKGKAIATRNLWISIPESIAGFLGLDGVVRSGRQNACHRLQFLGRGTVLAGGPPGTVRRYAAHLLQLHDTDFRWP